MSEYLPKSLFFAVWNLPELRGLIKSFMWPGQRSANWYDYINGDAAYRRGYTEFIRERHNADFPLTYNIGLEMAIADNNLDCLISMLQHTNRISPLHIKIAIVCRSEEALWALIPKAAAQKIMIAKGGAHGIMRLKELYDNNYLPKYSMCEFQLSIAALLIKFYPAQFDVLVAAMGCSPSTTITHGQVQLTLF